MNTLTHAKDSDPDPDDETEFVNSERKERIALKGVVTGRISETSRLVGFGIVAWVFAVHTSETNFSETYISEYEFWVNTAGFLGMLTIIFDFLQYLCAYSSVNHALKRKDANYSFNKNHPAYILQAFFFGAKQACAAVGSLLVASTFGLLVILH